MTLLYLLSSYTETPIEDREEEEKYYYRLKGFDDSWIYLISCKTLDTFELGTFSEARINKCAFTDKEFEALPDEVKSHNWEKIKVDREWSEMD